ncbi:hypothetical protein H6504_05105 [Candidatus Woesearchaeota archaeon]|nr:hypothetical protein [Candidatus Woesearchaeota archaeon]
MTLTANEKELIRKLLTEHLKHIDHVEGIPSPDVAMLAAEVRYEEFVKGIISKLK